MKLARAKAAARHQKFSTYVARLLEADVSGQNTSEDDPMLAAAEDVLYLRTHHPEDVFKPLLSAIKEGRTFGEFVTANAGSLANAPVLSRVRRAYSFLCPVASQFNQLAAEPRQAPYKGK